VIPTFFVRFVILSVLCGLTGTEIEIEVEVSLKPECAARQDFRLVGLGTGKNDAASPKLGRQRRYVTKLTCFHPTRWTPLKYCFAAKQQSGARHIGYLTASFLDTCTAEDVTPQDIAAYWLR
jgi:hypothetical protein